MYPERWIPDIRSAPLFLVVKTADISQEGCFMADKIPDIIVTIKYGDLPSPGMQLLALLVEGKIVDIGVLTS